MTRVYQALLLTLNLLLVPVVVLLLLSTRLACFVTLSLSEWFWKGGN